VRTGKLIERHKHKHERNKELNEERMSQDETDEDINMDFWTPFRKEYKNVLLSLCLSLGFKLPLRREIPSVPLPSLVACSRSNLASPSSTRAPPPPGVMNRPCRTCMNRSLQIVLLLFSQVGNAYAYAYIGSRLEN
jgi:hypothetical protein